MWWPQSCSKDPYLLAGTQTLPKMVSNLAAVKITGSCPACAGVNGELTVSLKWPVGHKWASGC